MCLCAFSIMMMTASTIAPIAMAIPPNDMMLELIPCRYITSERDQNCDRQNNDGDERAAEMQQKCDADKRDDDALFDEFSFQVLPRRGRSALCGRMRWCSSHPVADAFIA